MEPDRPMQITATPSQQPSRAIASERGFALPMTIFLVTLVTILLAGAFTRAGTELALADSHAATVKALGVAQSGLQLFVGDTTTVRPTPGDSVRINVLGGYAWVVADLMQAPADTLDDYTYIIRSTGYYIEPNQGSIAQAKWTVAQFVKWRQSVHRPAAYIAANRNDVDYSSPPGILVTGHDACTSNVIGGARAPATSDGLPGSVWGSPDELNAGTAFEIASALGIDWTAVENGDFAADYTSLAAANGDTTFSTYLIDGFQTNIGGINGTGLLIVRNRIDSYGFDWDGVVIAGKDFDLRDGTTRIRGMLITGMDVLVGDSDYPTTTFDAGTALEVRYNSCYVARAFASLRALVPVAKARIDNWASW